MGAGLVGAGTGTLVGGVTGGTFSGVKSLFQGKNFWTGVPKSGTGITYNKLNVDRPNLGSEFPQRELAKVEMASAARNPTARPSSLGNNTIDTGNLRIDLEMGRAAAKGMHHGTNAVYQGLDAGGKVRYVGITSRAPGVRFAEHLNSIGTGKELLRSEVIKGATGLSRTGARIWEQTLINQYGLGRNAGQLFNMRNSIAPKNWWQYGIR